MRVYHCVITVLLKLPERRKLLQRACIKCHRNGRCSPSCRLRHLQWQPLISLPVPNSRLYLPSLSQRGARHAQRRACAVCRDERQRAVDCQRAAKLRRLGRARAADRDPARVPRCAAAEMAVEVTHRHDNAARRDRSAENLLLFKAQPLRSLAS
eukprot:scaffold114223_cov36-Phaeocystis_antarctica.AAC.1